MITISFYAAFLFFIIIISENNFSQSQLKEIEDFSLSPISAFKDNCARCHGEEGSAYGKDFADLKDQELRKVIEDMMFGPSFLNPDSIEVDAMTSYNKSLKENKPFAAAVNSKSFLEGKDNYLKIETSRNAKLEIENSSIHIENNKGVWILKYDFRKVHTIKIKVTKNKLVSTFIFPTELWTNKIKKK